MTYKIPTYFVYTFLLFLPLQTWNSVAFPAMTSKTIFAVGFASAFFLILLVNLLKEDRTSTIKFTSTDTFLSIAVIYALIHGLWIKPAENDFFRDAEVLCLISTYFVIRNLKYKKNLLIFIVLITVLAIESIWGLMQHLGILTSYNQLFPITGSFFNPAPYAGYLATTFPALVGLILVLRRLKITGDKLKKDILLFLLQCIGITAILMLYLSKSRAAILAASASIVFLIIASKGCLIKNRILLFQSKYRLVSTIFMGVIVFISLAWLGIKFYQQRPDSIYGRLLIWECTTQMISKHPFTGIGIGGFKANYIHYQANYLNTHIDNELALSADNTLFCFNEYLETASEVGIPGLIIFLLVPLSVFRNVYRSEFTVLIARAGILGLMTFACFSYPISVLPLKVLFVVFLAIVAGNQ